MKLHALNLTSQPWLAFLPDTPGAAPFPLPPGLSEHDLEVNEGTFLLFGPDEGFAEQLTRAFTADETGTVAAIAILPDGRSTSAIMPPPSER